jgi:hypothetical protein
MATIGLSDVGVMTAGKERLLGQRIQLPATDPWAAVTAPAVKLDPAALQHHAAYHAAKRRLSSRCPAAGETSQHGDAPSRGMVATDCQDRRSSPEVTGAQVASYGDLGRA